MEGATTDAPDPLRLCLQRQHPYGSDRFRTAIEAQLGRHCGPARVGRAPKKTRVKVHSDPCFLTPVSRPAWSGGMANGRTTGSGSVSCPAARAWPLTSRRARWSAEMSGVMAVRPRMYGAAETLCRFPSKARMRKPTHSQKRRSTKAHARKSGKTRIRLSAFEENRQCGFQ